MTYTRRLGERFEDFDRPEDAEWNESDEFVDSVIAALEDLRRQPKFGMHSQRCLDDVDGDCSCSGGEPLIFVADPVDGDPMDVDPLYDLDRPNSYWGSDW
jgi:hypothetical protein